MPNSYMLMLVFPAELSPSFSWSHEKRLIREEIQRPSELKAPLQPGENPAVSQKTFQNLDSFKAEWDAKVTAAAKKLDLTWASGSLDRSDDDQDNPRAMKHWERNLEDTEHVREVQAKQNAVQELVKFREDALKGAQEIDSDFQAKLNAAVEKYLAELEGRVKVENEAAFKNYADRKDFDEETKRDMSWLQKVFNDPSRSASANEALYKLNSPTVNTVNSLREKVMSDEDFVHQTDALSKDEGMKLTDIAKRAWVSLPDGIDISKLPAEFVEEIKNPQNRKKIYGEYLAFLVQHTGLETSIRPLKDREIRRTSAYEAARVRGESRRDALKEAKGAIGGTPENSTAELSRFSEEEVSMQSFLEALAKVRLARKIFPPIVPKTSARAGSERSPLRTSREGKEVKSEVPFSSPSLLGSLGLANERELRGKTHSEMIQLVMSRNLIPELQKDRLFAKMDPRELANWFDKFFPQKDISSASLIDSLILLTKDLEAKPGEIEGAKIYLNSQGWAQPDENIATLLAIRFSITPGGAVFALDGKTAVPEQQIHECLRTLGAIQGEYQEGQPFSWNPLDETAKKEIFARVQSLSTSREKQLLALQGLQNGLQQKGTGAEKLPSGWSWPEFWKFIADLFGLHGGLWEGMEQKANENLAATLLPHFKLASRNDRMVSFAFEGTATEKDQNSLKDEKIRRALATKLLERDDVEIPAEQEVGNVKFQNGTLIIELKDSSKDPVSEWKTLIAQGLQEAKNRPAYLKNLLQAIGPIGGSEFRGKKITTAEERANLKEATLEELFLKRENRNIWSDLKDTNLGSIFTPREKAIATFWLEQAQGEQGIDTTILDTLQKIELEKETGDLVITWKDGKKVKFLSGEDAIALQRVGENAFGFPEEYGLNAKKVLEVFSSPQK